MKDDRQERRGCMLEKAIVEFCSPTLAGLKTAGMFGYPFQSERKLFEELEQMKSRLKEYL